MSLTALLEKYAPCTVEHHGRLYSFRQGGKGERTLVLLHGIGTAEHIQMRREMLQWNMMPIGQKAR